MDTRREDEDRVEQVSDDRANRTIVAKTSVNRAGNVRGIEDLSKERINALKLTELKEELKVRNLSTIGTKRVLQQRLRDYAAKMEGVRDEGDSEESESDVDTEDSGDEGQVEQKQEKQRRYKENKTRNEAASMFTIKDVEGSLGYFTGDDKLPIKKWVSDFEDMSKLLGWNELQQFVYGKRMLQGSARKFITFEKHVTSWDKLKCCLTSEFHVRKSNAEVHSQLYRRKKLSNESSRQYVYEMQEIADQGDVDEEALIQYIIDGISDQESNKTILYGSHSLRSLKKNFEVYDRMKGRMNHRKEQAKKEGRKEKETSTSKRERKIHCYVCGSAEHTMKDCTNRDKGPKCFKCNAFGHIAANCNKEVGNKPDNKTDRIDSVRLL